MATKDNEQTNVSNIYAIGDVLNGKPELTPVAIQAGKLLAQRLFQGSLIKTDYVNVATTVFTPIEYGTIGISEEDAVKTYGESDLAIYHTKFQAIEQVIVPHAGNDCFMKLICVKSKNELVVSNLVHIKKFICKNIYLQKIIFRKKLFTKKNSKNEVKSWIYL